MRPDEDCRSCSGAFQIMFGMMVSPFAMPAEWEICEEQNAPLNICCQPSPPHFHFLPLPIEEISYSMYVVADALRGD